jgi:hypothetical protein
MGHKNIKFLERLSLALSVHLAATRYVRFREDRTPALQKLAPLFDHLVGKGEQRRRHAQAQRLRGLEVDHKAEPVRLHDRQVGRLFAFENPPNVTPP